MTAAHKIIQGLDEAVASAPMAQFLAESNRIEGIFRVTAQEIDAATAFISLHAINVPSVVAFVQATQPDAILRDQNGLDVRLGRYIAPKGHPKIRQRLAGLLKAISADEFDPYMAHIRYEKLHPFTDGNGRSGRMIWLWHMCRRQGWPALGFLHTFYYQTLSKA